MYLKELSINGFKSFAKKGELEFCTPITAIVGPNGSGKSNVAEAFRFVLGEQSPSRMRGKKGEDLIWGGSKTAARSNRASVAITLSNERRVFPIEFDEITIERVVNRDGANEYFINGSRTRLKDVQELLAAANIGPTGHHIISQGEADRILSSTPRERREMIEDALGLKVYQYKKNESEKKLKKTHENITQAESLRREVAPQLKFLERQVKKVEKAVTLKEELKDVYAEYLKREDVYLTLRTQQLSEERVIPAARQQELVAELTQAREQLQNAEHDEKREQLVVLEHDITAVRSERQEVVRAQGKVEGQIQFIESRLERVQQEHTPAHAPIPYQELADVAQTVETQVTEATNTTDVSVLQRTLGEVLATVRTLLRQDFAAQTDNTAEDRATLDELTKERVAYTEQLADITSREQVLQERYERLRQEIEADRSANREAERATFAIMNEQREIEHTLAQIDGTMRDIERDRADFTNEVQEAVALIGSAAARYKTYMVGVPDSEIVAEDREKQRERRRSLEKMKIRLEELGGGDDEEIMREYKEVKARDAFLAHEIEDLHQSVGKLETLIEDLTKQLNEQFVAGIDTISVEFNRFFTLMFGGGEAQLVRVTPKPRKQRDTTEEGLSSELSEEEDTESLEGIELDVQLPNKRVRGLDMLSGGERALTSIALIFAMSQVNPPLFVILDETDAALDEANSRRYGDMIESLAKRSQLILITHNRETMSRAGVLYGVTMGNDGVSKLLSVQFDEAVQVAK